MSDLNYHCVMEAAAPLSGRDALALARGVVEEAKASPERGLAVVAELIDSDDALHRCSGLWAQGSAFFEQGRNVEAIDSFKQALEIGHVDLRGWIGVSLAAAEVAAGVQQTARRRLQELVDDGHDDDLKASASAQLGFLMIHDGAPREALHHLNVAVDLLNMSQPDRPLLARALGNVGVCHMLVGELRAAENAWLGAHEHAESAGQDLVIAGLEQNLAYTRMCLGDLPGAIQRGRRALTLYRELGEAGRNLSTLYDDLAEIHRFAGLTKDAVRYARLSLWVARQGSNVEKQSDAEFRRARCLLDHGNVEAAAASAAKAAKMFSAAGRNVWVQRSRLLVLEAAARADHTGSGGVGRREPSVADVNSIIDDVKEITGELTQAGWIGESVAARNLAAQVVADLGDVETARRLLADNPPSAELRSENISDRLEGIYGTALAYHLAGQENSRLLDSARVLVDTSTSTLVDPELRAGLARQLARFRNLDLDRVLSDGADPWAVVEAEERWRDVSTRAASMSFANSNADSELLSQLRLLHQERTASIERSAELDSRILKLEQEIRERSMAQAVGESAAVATRVDGRVEVSHLGCDRHLVEQRLNQPGPAPSVVEFVEHRGELLGVGFSLRDNAETVWTVGPMDDLKAELDRATRDLRRLLTSPATSRTVGPKWSALQDDYRCLGSRLFGDVLGERRPLVVAPPFQLGAVPWSLVAGDTAMVSVVGGVGQWCRQSPVRPPRSVGAVAGPGLPEASTDTAALEVHFGGDITRACDDEATSETLLSMLASLDLVHVSAHCSFRDDSVMFSSVEMSDGPVPIYELGRLPDTPSLVVLAACGAGRWQDVGAAQWLGIVPEMLRSGTDCLVAPIQVVANSDVGQVMTAFYQQLPALGAAEALATAQASLADANPRVQAAAHAFVVFGAASVGKLVGF